MLSNDNLFAQGQAAGAIGNIDTDDPTIIEDIIMSMGNEAGFGRSQALDSFHN